MLEYYCFLNEPNVPAKTINICERPYRPYEIELGNKKRIERNF